MNAGQVLKRSWQLLWQYRALWILGMVLALTAANTIYLGPWQDRQEQPQDIRIILPNHSVLTLAGEGLTIDFSAPGAARMILTDGTIVELDDRLLTDLVRQMRGSDFMTIAVEVAILLMIIVLVTAVFRYVAEAGVIRMVNETEATGRQLTLREGLRLGWSVRALRLFLIDLVMGLIFLGILALALPTSIGSIMLAEPLGTGAILAAIFGVLGLLGVAGILLVSTSLLASVIMQPIRRACVIDGLGVFASIRAGIAMLGHHLKDIGITWAIWIAIRILWAPLGLLAAVILSPVLLISLLTGVVAGGLFTGLVASVAAPFVNGPTPWIIGGIAGFPLFVLVTILPLLFVGGLVELYKSNLWTLAYRELRGMESTAEAVEPIVPLNPAPGIAK